MRGVAEVGIVAERFGCSLRMASLLFEALEAHRVTEPRVAQLARSEERQEPTTDSAQNATSATHTKQTTGLTAMSAASGSSEIAARTAAHAHGGP